MSTCAPVWAFPPAPLELAPFRRFHCTATIGNKIYVFGGETKMRSLNDPPDQEAIKRMLADLIVYDTEIDDWSVVCPAAPTGPARRKGAVLVAYKDTSLFLFGGAGPGVTLNDLWEYSLREKRWIDRSRHIVQSLLEFLPQQCSATRDLLKAEDNYKLTETIACERPDLYPLPRAYHTAAVYGHRIFVYGGHGVKVASSTLWSFDLREYTWHSIPMQSAKTEAPASDPGCRFGLTSCVHGGSMYFFGGQQNGKLVNSTLWSLDLERLCWHQIQAAGVPPTPRTYGASCLIGNRWLIHGGSTADHVFADSHELDLKTLQWNPAPTLHTAVPLEGHQAICTHAPWGGTTVLLFGGASSGPLSPDGPLLRCDFFLPPETIAEKLQECRVSRFVAVRCIGGVPTSSMCTQLVLVASMRTWTRPWVSDLCYEQLEDFAIRPVAAADLIWKFYLAGARAEHQILTRQRAEKEMSEALDNLRLRYDEMCERYELLLQERTLMARAPQVLLPDLTKLQELQSKVEDLQSQLTRYATKKSHAKEETSVVESRYEETVRREQVIIEHISTTTRQLRTTRQRIRDDLEYPLTRLTEDVSHDLRLFELAEASLAAAEQISEDVAAAIASLKTVATAETASPLSSSRVSRPKSTARASSVHDSAKRRPARPSVSPSRAAVRSKSVSADSAHSAPRAALRNKSVGKRPSPSPEVKTSGTPVHRHAEHVKKTTTPAIRQSSPGQDTISSTGTKSKKQVDDSVRQSTPTETRRARAHEVVPNSESLVDAGAAGQHMSSPIQQIVPVRVRGVNRGVSVNRTSKLNAVGDLATQGDQTLHTPINTIICLATASETEVVESRVVIKTAGEGLTVSPVGINRSTQCGSGVLKLRTSHNAENEKMSARSTAGISKGIGADT